MDPTKKELYTAKRPSGLDTSNADLQPAIDKLRSDEDPTNWLLLKVAGTTVLVHNLGNDGLTGFSASLKDDDAYYGVIRCTVDGMVKFYHVYFVGQNISGMKKGKASMYKSAIFSMIDAQGEISCPNGMEEYSSEFILANISQLAKSMNIEIV